MFPQDVQTHLGGDKEALVSYPTCVSGHCDRKVFLRIVDMKDKTAQEAVHAEKDNMQVWHKINRSIGYGMKVFSGNGMENFKFRHMGVGCGNAIPGSYLLCLSCLKIMAEERCEIGGYGALVRTGVYNAKSLMALAGLRINDSNGKNRVVDPILERTERAVSYRHQYMWTRFFSGI